MKRREISAALQDFPAHVRPILQGAHIFDSSCSKEARVWYIEKEEGFYLKRAPHGTLSTEAELTRYFHAKGLSAAVVDYRSETYDWLLTARIPGEDCTHAQYLDAPARLCDCIATQLRTLHELSFANCPVQNRTALYGATAEKNHAAGVFDSSFLPVHLQKMTADEAFSFFSAGKHLLKNDTLLHGDYCLPNILLDDWRFSGFIDLGNGGVGDRHVDLFWGAWTLAFNLGTNRYRSRFFDAYGRDGIDFELLDIIAAAECLG